MRSESLLWPNASTVSRLRAGRDSWGAEGHSLLGAPAVSFHLFRWIKRRRYVVPLDLYPLLRAEEAPAPDAAPQQWLDWGAAHCAFLPEWREPMARAYRAKWPTP